MSALTDDRPADEREKEQRDQKYSQLLALIEELAEDMPWTTDELRRIYAAQGCMWQGADSYHGHTNCDRLGLLAVYRLGYADGRMTTLKEEGLIV